MTSTVLTPAPVLLHIQNCRVANAGPRSPIGSLLFVVHYSARRDAPSRRPRLHASSRAGAEAAAPWCGKLQLRRLALRRRRSRLRCASSRTLPTLAGPLPSPLSLGATTLVGREGSMGGTETRAARRKKRVGGSAGRGTHWNLRKERFLGAFASAMAPKTHSRCFLLLRAGS